MLVHNNGGICPEEHIFRNWNDFQAGTKGRFETRTEAAEAWHEYKIANNIATGTVRNPSVRRNFLKSPAEDPNTPSWMKQWLKQGRVPPGYEVDHIVPLSIGGADVPNNMRLQLKELHRVHHRFYRPWESSAMAESRKVLVAFDPSEPNKQSSDFLIPIYEDGQLKLIGTKSKSASEYGIVVLTK